jgi:hypothetical protein
MALGDAEYAVLNRRSQPAIPALFVFAHFRKANQSDQAKNRTWPLDPKASTGTFEALECSLTNSSGEIVMTRFGTMAAACLAVALAATSPALARGGHGGRGGGAGFHGGAAHFAGGGFRGGGFRRGVVGPGIAAGIVAGSVIGAGAYYGGYGPGYDDSYAYDNGYNGGYDNGYAVRNGFVCQPGTFFRGEDGRRYLCQ